MEYDKYMQNDDDRTAYSDITDKMYRHPKNMIKIGSRKTVKTVGYDEDDRTKGPRKETSVVNVYLYASKGQGSTIVDAITGMQIPNHRVGSIYENLHFSLVDSRANDKEKEPHTFYFDSPSQYESFMHNNLPEMKVRISAKTKQLWHSKKLATQKQLN